MSAYLQPWILARLCAGLVTIALTLRGVQIARRVIKKWHLGSSSEGQLLLERRADLVSTLVSAGLAGTILGLVVTLFGADRQAASISGAMCAYGVFDSTQAGFWSLAVSFVSAIGATVWLMVHRLDRQTRQPVFTTRKFSALMWLAPLVVCDTAVFFSFVGQLDLSANATCCSVSLGDAGGGVNGLSGGPGLQSFLWATGVSVATAAAAWWSTYVKRRRVGWRTLAAAGALAATALWAPAVLRFVAPHVYQTPHHRCPFCLLHGDYALYGWGLLITFFLALSTSLGATVIGWLGWLHRTSPDAWQAAENSARRLAGHSASLWLLFCVIASAPILRYLWMTKTLVTP